MLIAVGMYLPFESTSAIFVGGLIKWVFELSLKRKDATDEERGRAGNTGVLVSSGFIAGESLMAVILALLVMGSDKFPVLTSFQALAFLAEPSFLLGLLGYVIAAYMLIWLPVSRMRAGGLSSHHLDH
jgi:ABC-type dipeptide/oligopeptide/nickel transport system permease component